MSFSSYMRSSAWDYVLVVAAAWSASCVGMNAFYLDGLAVSLGYWGRAGLALVVCAALCLMLFAASWSRRRLAFGLAAYVAVLAALFAVAVGLSGGEHPYADVEGNYLYFAAVTALPATACFALSRTIAGSAAWFAGSALACSVVQAFYQAGEVAMSLFCALAGLALIVHRNFRLGLTRSESAGRPSHARTFVASVLPVCVVGAISVAAWFAVIAPMEPGQVDVNLLTEYRQLPVDQIKGTAEEKPVLNFDMKSQNLVEGFPYTTDDLKEDPSSLVTIDAASLLEQQLQQQMSQLDSGTGAGSGGGERDVLDLENPEQEYDPISWTETFPWAELAFALAVLLVVVVAGYFVGRRMHRARRLERMLSLPAREQVEALYLFLLGRLERIGFKVPAGLTLAEFAAASERQMDVITDVTRVGFGDITALYEGCVYGDVVPDDEAMLPLVAYYLGFWKAARAHLGPLRYFAKSFRL